MRRRNLLLIFAILAALTACSRDPDVAKRRLVEAGNKYFDRGKFREASIIYRKALQKDRRYGEGYYRLGLTEIKLGRLMEATRALQRACELEPGNEDAHGKLADLYLLFYLSDARSRPTVLRELNEITEQMEKRDPNAYDVLRVRGYLALWEAKIPEAISLFRRALETKPGEPRMTLALIEALSADDQLQEAERVAKALLEKEKTFAPAYDALYMQYARQKRYAEAEAILKQKCENNPKQARFMLQLAGHYRLVGKRAEMLETLERLAQNPKDFPRARLDAGDFCLGVREIDLALKYYREGAEQESEHKSEYQNRMAEALAVQGKRQEAMQLVEAVLKAEPKNSQALSIRGALQLQSGDRTQIDAAIADFQAAMSQAPENIVMRFNLGEAYLAKGEPERAITQFQEAIKLRPDYLPPKYSLARTYLAKRDFANASRLADEILGMRPQDLTAKLLRSNALIGLGNAQLARQELEAILRQSPGQRDALYHVATLDLLEKRFRQAEDRFRQLYQGNPPDLRGLLGLAETHAAQGQPGVAQQLLEKEMERSPDDQGLRFALANLCLRSGDLQRAIAEFKNILTKQPNSGEVHVRVGEAYYHAGKQDLAEEHFRKAKELAPGDSRAHLLLGVIYDSTGRTAEAKGAYEQTLKLAPDNPVALNNLAYLLAESSGDLDLALTLIQRARSRAPQSPDIADTLGWIYIKKNLNDNAIQILSDLVTKHPSQVTWRYHLAMALYQKGNKAQAKKELEAALRYKPTPEEEGKIRALLAKTGT